jgi:hypothetical protein
MEPVSGRIQAGIPIICGWKDMIEKLKNIMTNRLESQREPRKSSDQLRGKGRKSKNQKFRFETNLMPIKQISPKWRRKMIGGTLGSVACGFEKAKDNARPGDKHEMWKIIEGAAT